MQVLLDIVDNPKHNKFTVAPLEYERRGQRVAPPTVTFRASERAILDAPPAARAATECPRAETRGRHHRCGRAGARPRTAASLEVCERADPAPGRRWQLGRHQDISLQWELARMILSNGSAEPAFDAFVRDWYPRDRRARPQCPVLRLGSIEGGASWLFPNDSVLLLLAGCEREAFATPLFQVFAQSFRNARMRPNIASEDAELDAAAGFFRRALAADEGLGEARVRLGRVLSLKERYADSARELRRALDGRLDPVLQYLAELFLGAALEGLGEAAVARDAFRRAADGTPGARAAIWLSRALHGNWAIARKRRLAWRRRCRCLVTPPRSIPGGCIVRRKADGAPAGSTMCGGQRRARLDDHRRELDDFCRRAADGRSRGGRSAANLQFTHRRRAVDTLVSEAGAPLAGLGPGDFEVRDNGVRQEIDLVSLADVPGERGPHARPECQRGRGEVDGPGRREPIASGRPGARGYRGAHHLQRCRRPASALTRRIDDVREALDESEADEIPPR